MKKILRIIGKIIYWPHLMLRDWALLGNWPSLKAQMKWLKETRNAQKIEFADSIEVLSKRK